MTIIVTQLNQEAASQCVTVYLDGAEIGRLGPGDSVQHFAPPGPHTLRCLCGCYDKSIPLSSDSNVTVKWDIHSPAMVVDASPLR